MESAAIITAAILMFPGILMAFVPMLPALSYMFVIALIFGFVDRFSTLSGKEILFLLLIVIVSIVIDHTSGILGAKYGGAHTKSLLWGILGAVLGTFFLTPPLGSLLGLFVAIFLAELRFKKNRAALKAASGALIGSAIGVMVNIALAAIFFGLFLFFVLN